MSNIDQRVVEMQFDNKAFGTNIKTSIDDLAKLKKGLQLDGATKGISDVQSAADKFNMENMNKAVDKAQSRIDVFRIFCVTAIYTISSQLVHLGENLIKSLTIDPVAAGLQSYADTINATQIIMANTKAAGTTLPQITAALANLQAYANQTVYSFADMTQNIGRFTAAGVKLQPATDAIKGMANVAALSGASTEQMSGAMYQMSQALSAGVIKLQDWNSLSNANMAGQGIQEALKETARTMDDHGVKMDAAIKKQKNFRNSLTEGWLTADIYTKAMGVFGGTMDASTGKFRAFTVEELKAKGYTEAASKSLHQLSQDALNSAVNIRTIPQMMQALKEEVATAWGQIFKSVFGDINQATDLFSGLHNTIEAMLTGPLYAFNDVLQGWQKLGGRTALIEGLKMAFADLMAIIKPIHDAFREIFPPETAAGLLSLTAGFRVLMGHLKMGEEAGNNLKRTFAGLFAIIDIGAQFIKAAVGFLAQLIGHFAEGTGGIGKFTGGIGDFLTNLDHAIKSGDIFGNFFKMITPWIEKPVDALKRFVGFLVSLVQNIGKVTGVTSVLGNLNEGAKNFSKTGDQISTAWGNVKQVLEAIWQAIHPIITAMTQGLGDIGKGLGDFISNLSMGDLIGATGLAGLLKLIKLIGDGLDKFLSKDPIGEFVGSVRESLEALTGTLRAMQNTLKATTLIEIAGAILLLTIAVSQLSNVKSDGLGKAVIAIGYMLTALVGAFLLLNKFTSQTKALKMDVIAAGLILIATAIDILASAAVKLGNLSWNDLVKGLLGVSTLLGAVALSLRLMPEKSKMISSSLGILVIAEAIKLLSDSVKDLAKMNWETMSRGIAGIAGLLLSLGLFSRLQDANKGGIANGIGLVLLATALKILSGVVKDFGNMSWDEIGKGLATLAGSLTAIAVALRIMPWGDLAKSTSLVIVAASLKILASAIKDMAGLSWTEIGRGLTTLAGGLTLIVAALNLMPWGNLTKSVSLVILATSLKILASAMSDMGSMSWSEIGKSLVELAGSLTIMVTAMNLLPWGGVAKSVAILILAGALKVLASAMGDMGGMSWGEIAKSLVELAGALTIIGVAVTLMDASLPGAAALIIIAGALAIMVPVLESLGGMSWSDIAVAMVGLAGLFAILAAAGAASPLIMALSAALAVLGGAVALFGLGVLALGAGVYQFADGLRMLSKIDAQGIHNIANALGALIKLIPAFFIATAQGFIDFAKKIGDNAKTFGDAAAKMIDQFIRIINQKMPQAVEAMATGTIKMLSAIDKHMPEFVQKGSEIIIKWLLGIAKNMKAIGDAGTKAAVAFMQSVGSHAKEMADAGAKMVINILNGIADSIRNNVGKFRSAAGNIAGAILDGLTLGLSDKIGGVLSKIGDIGGSMLGKLKGVLGIQSPSREFMKIGQFVTQGLVQGLTSGQGSVDNAVQNLGNSLTSAVQNSADATVNAQNRLNTAIAAQAANNRALAAAQQQLARAENSRGKGRAAAIQAAQLRLSNLRATAAKDAAAIRAEQATLNQARLEHARDAAALAITQSNKYLDEQDQLDKLSLSYDDYTQKIKDATSALDAATKTRDDYNASLKTSFGTQETITKDTHLTDYVANLQKQIVDTQNFAIAVQELRKRGLNDELYKQILADGTSVMPFVQELLAGGSNSIVQLNTLGKTLDKAAGGIADSASKSLYQAAVDSAAGFLKGLQDQQAAIEAQMNKIAASMVGAIKKALGIKSPSTEFAAVGAFSAQGLANGLDASSDVVAESAKRLGNKAIDTMKKTVSGLGDLISESIDTNPVIKPVLDLTDFNKSADALTTIYAPGGIRTDGLVRATRDASFGWDANAAHKDTPATESQPNITFIQNNTSPKELTQAEIYRQTNNQLAVAKGALTRSRAN